MMGGGFEDELMERIRTGDIAIDLYRPADLQLWWLAADLGRAAFQLLGRGMRADGGWARSSSRWRCPRRRGSGWRSWSSVALGVVVSFAVRYLVALTAFWLLDGAGVTQIALLAGLFFSGMLLPLTLFPGAAGRGGAGAAVVGAAPGARRRAPRRAHGVAGWWGRSPSRRGWALALLLAGRLVQSVATRRVVVQGG